MLKRKKSHTNRKISKQRIANRLVTSLCILEVSLPSFHMNHEIANEKEEDLEQNIEKENNRKENKNETAQLPNDVDYYETGVL